MTTPHRPTVDTSGIERGGDGIARYTGLERNLVTLLRRAVDAHPDRVAVVELGGASLTYAPVVGPGSPGGRGPAGPGGAPG